MSESKETFDLSPQFVWWLLVLYRGGLITSEQLGEWSTHVIGVMSTPPTWVTDVAISNDLEACSSTLNEYIFPLPPIHNKIEIFLACSYLKFERGEINWAQFLNSAGLVTDSGEAMIDCACFYILLNELESGQYRLSIQEQQRKDVELLFRKIIETTRKAYAHFCHLLELES